MSRLLSATRYLILVPIIGLAIATAYFFIFGGIGLFLLLREVPALVFGFGHGEGGTETSVLVYETVEYVHTFLVGTVLYLTAIGLYQLFIRELPGPAWMRVHNTEELETNLIGVTVVVLAVNFMGATFSGDGENLLSYGAGIALPITALGVFVGLRAWAARLNHDHHAHQDSQSQRTASQGASTAASDSPQQREELHHDK